MMQGGSATDLGPALSADPFYELQRRSILDDRDLQNAWMVQHLPSANSCLFDGSVALPCLGQCARGSVAHHREEPVPMVRPFPCGNNTPGGFARPCCMPLPDLHVPHDFSSLGAACGWPELSAYAEGTNQAAVWVSWRGCFERTT